MAHKDRKGKNPTKTGGLYCEKKKERDKGTKVVEDIDNKKEKENVGNEVFEELSRKLKEKRRIVDICDMEKRNQNMKTCRNLDTHGKKILHPERIFTLEAEILRTSTKEAFS